MPAKSPARTGSPVGAASIHATNGLERPAPFRFGERREWVACDIAGMEGFAILLRTSITIGEQRDLVARYRDIRVYAGEVWDELAEDARDFAESPHMRERALIAPFVLDWNAEGINAETGEYEPLPPPIEAGPAVFDCIEPEALDWVFSIVLVGYYTTGKAQLPPPRSAPIGTTSGPSSQEPLPSAETT
jgi:hypothetical protein